ncbi:hypothetical protein DSO57_1019109 [Entomophthora muscae]|uniref:Uncharacterized protein n=1 Tax=Entomophthora muscae TaxID=34485 RepID=A0ACC2UDF6_9FUNG|nr:hypothetical protein DSO57_1019109 [Entomophthora muscae]
MLQHIRRNSGDMHRNLVYDVLLFSIGPIGLLLNGLLLKLIASKRSRPAIDCILLTIIAELDLLTSVYIIVSQVWKWLSGYSVVRDASAWCYLSSSLGRMAKLASLDVTALLSLVRYVAIVRGANIVNRYWLAVAIMLIGVIAALFTVKSVFTIPTVAASGLYCFALHDFENPVFIAFHAILPLFAVPPLFIIPTCYALVISHYRRILTQITDTLPRHLVYQSRGLLVITIAYALVIIPEYLIIVLCVYFKVEVSPDVDSMARILISSITIVNPLFALFLHEDTRKELFSHWSKTQVYPQ